MSEPVNPPSAEPSRSALSKFAGDAVWFAALAVVLFVLLHKSLFTGKGLVPADAVLRWPPWNQTDRAGNLLLSDQYLVFLPTQEFVHQQKSFPLWNPYLCCGVPNLGSIQGAMLFPIRLLLAPLGPFAASGPAAFLKLWLAGSFTLLYLRLLGASRPAAFLAGLVFSLSGFMIVWLGHPHVNCAMWLPLLLYFVEKSFRLAPTNPFAPRALRAWAGFAIAFAFMLLGGHPPTAIHVALVAGIYFLFRLFEYRHAHALQRIGLMAGSVAVGVLLAAPQILPYLEYYRLSSSAVSSVSVARWNSHLNPASCIHFLLPNALGNPARGFEDMGDKLQWPVADNFNERTGYVGILPLFLAACALALRRCKFSGFFCALAFVSLLTIFGVWPIPSLIRFVPILHDVNQTRLLLIIGFSTAILAGLGFDELLRMQNRTQTLIATGAFFLIVGLALFRFYHVTGPHFHDLDAPHWRFLRRQFLILGGGLAVAVVLALWPAQWNRCLATAIALSCVIADLLAFALGYNPAISRDRYYPSTPALAWLQKDPSPFRILGGGSVLGPDAAEVFGLSDARGGDYMTVRRYEELITGKSGDFFFYFNADEIPKAFPLLNVKYLLSAKPLPVPSRQYNLVYSNEIVIYQYKQCVDRALLVYDYQVETNQAALLARVSTGTFDPRQLLLLEDQPTPAKPTADNPSAAASASDSVHITSYEPDDIKIDASLPRPGYLLLLDTWFPGWTATVNGESAAILRADYNFRAVPLPAGKSTVNFSYRPQSFRLGLYLCALGLLAIAAALFLSSKQKPAQD